MTKRSNDIYELVIIKGHSIEYVARTLNISPRAVYKHLKIAKKDIQNNSFSAEPKKVHKVGRGSFIKGQNQVRLHGVQINAKLIDRGKKYLVGTTVRNKEYTIRCFSKSLDIYVLKSYYGRDSESADYMLSTDMWNMLAQIENDLGVSIVKDRKCNIRICKSHYADLENELAKDCIRNNRKVKVVGFDNKEWLIIDNSNKVPELETIHPNLSAEDMRNIVMPFFNSLREIGKGDIILDLMKVDNNNNERIKKLESYFRYSDKSGKRFDRSYIG